MDFAAFLLTLMALAIIFEEPAQPEEKLTSPEYGYNDPQYDAAEETAFYPVYDYADLQSESDINSSPVPSTSLPEDNATLPAETEVTPSDYEEINVAEENIQMDHTVTVTTEMDILPQDNEDFTATTDQLELDATPTVQVEINATVTNDTSITQTEDTPLPSIATLLKFAIIMITIVTIAVFITKVLIMCDNFCLLYFMIKYHDLDEIYSENTEVVKVKNQDTFII